MVRTLAATEVGSKERLPVDFVVNFVWWQVSVTIRIFFDYLKDFVPKQLQQGSKKFRLETYLLYRLLAAIKNQDGHSPI